MPQPKTVRVRKGDKVRIRYTKGGQPWVFEGIAEVLMNDCVIVLNIAKPKRAEIPKASITDLEVMSPKPI